MVAGFAMVASLQDAPFSNCIFCLSQAKGDTYHQQVNGCFYWSKEAICSWTKQ